MPMVSCADVATAGIQVAVRNKMVDVIGNVCMDLSMVDLSQVSDVQEGDEVVLFGKEVPIEKWRWSVIPYPTRYCAGSLPEFKEDIRNKIVTSCPEKAISTIERRKEIRVSFCLYWLRYCGVREAFWLNCCPRMLLPSCFTEAFTLHCFFCFILVKSI